MNQTGGREGRPGGAVRDRGPATFGGPAQNLVGEAQAAKGVRARYELHAPGRHLEAVRTTGRVEHVRPLEEARERLAVLAVADEAEAGGRGDITCYAAHAAAPAAKREVMTSRRGDIPTIACHQRPAIGGATLGHRARSAPYRRIAFRCAVDIPLAISCWKDGRSGRI